MVDFSPASVPSSGGSDRVIAFIDSALSDYTTLIAGLKPGTQAYVLDATKDAISQITQVLAGCKDITSVALFTHGSEASLQLGHTQLDAQTISQYAKDLQDWAKALAPGADLLFYGCNVAVGQAGKAFV
ncbi:MAG TPA: DUF4347 domain-containing protein, partial [Allocoleopsis sp.]